jgi:hypothetical protein
MKVQKLEGPPFEKVQCQLPKTELREVGWRGYREQRAQVNGNDASTCMRHARWEVDGAMLCAQHAGLRALEFLNAQEA